MHVVLVLVVFCRFCPFSKECKTDLHHKILAPLSEKCFAWNTWSNAFDGIVKVKLAIPD